MYSLTIPWGWEKECLVFLMTILRGQKDTVQPYPKCINNFKV